jgi:hypothetical protein
MQDRRRARQFPLVWAAGISHAPLCAEIVASGGQDRDFFSKVARMLDDELQEDGLIARAVQTRHRLPSTIC